MNYTKYQKTKGHQQMMKSLNYAYSDRKKKKNQHKIYFGVFFVARVLKILSTEIQKTMEFYSVIYVDLNDEWQNTDSNLKLLKVHSSQKCLCILYNKTTFMLVTYCITILFFPNKIVIIKYLNYFFAFLNAKITTEQLLKICFSTKSAKHKLKKIMRVVLKGIYNILVINTLNLFCMTIFEVINFEHNYQKIEKILREVEDAKKNKTTKNIRQHFYLYLGFGLLVLLAMRFRLPFCMKSTDSLDDEKTKESEGEEDSEKKEDESILGMVMRVLGYQNLIENWQVFDSLPESEKKKIVTEYQFIKENYQLVMIIVAALTLSLTFLSAYSACSIYMYQHEQYYYPDSWRSMQLRRQESERYARAFPNG
jgi:hypothetical protein